MALPATRLSAQKIGIPRRNSPATYTDKNGIVQTAARNELRDKHYVNGLLQPPLIEAAATNVLLHSEELDDAAWTKTFTAVTPNAVIAPDGTLTGDKLTENDGGVLQAHTATQLFAGLPDNTIYTWSRWFKAAERGWALLSYQDKAGAFHPTWFDLTNGAIGVTSAGNNATIIEYPGQPGWWRATINVNTGAGATTPRVLTYIALANNVAGYIGTVGSGIYTWGAQLELGSPATSYIATATSPGARAADLEETIWVLLPGTSEQTLRRDVALGILADDGSTEVGFPIATPGRGRFPAVNARLSRQDLTRTQGSAAAVGTDYFFGSSTLNTTIVRPTRLPSGKVSFY